MYKRKLFESMDELLKWMNESKVAPAQIISIMPFQTEGSSGKLQLRREYEIIYNAGLFEKLERTALESDVNGLLVMVRNKDAELTQARKDAAEACRKAERLDSLLGKVQKERGAAESEIWALKQRNWWQRLTKKGE